MIGLGAAGEARGAAALRAIEAARAPRTVGERGVGFVRELDDVAAVGSGAHPHRRHRRQRLGGERGGEREEESGMASSE